MIEQPLNDNEQAILALRGKPVPERPGYFFGEEVIFKRGKYELRVVLVVTTSDAPI